MIVFVDTNVLLDVLVERQPFYDNSAHVWTLAEKGELQAFVSVLSFPNAAYVLRKQGRQAVRRALGLLQAVFHSVPLDEYLLAQALESDLPDYEDALQYYSALRAKATCLITRNIGHFPSDDLQVQTPQDFLAMHFSE